MQTRSRRRMGYHRERFIFWAWRPGKRLFQMRGKAWWALGMKAKDGGLTLVAFGLAFRGLVRRGFIKTEQVDDHDGSYDGAYVTDEGWRWIGEHDHLFHLEWRASTTVDSVDDFDDIPF